MLYDDVAFVLSVTATVGFVPTVAVKVELKESYTSEAVAFPFIVPLKEIPLNESVKVKALSMPFPNPGQSSAY